MDWVEKDFLDLDKWNIRQVTFDNYEVKEGKIIPSQKQILDYDSSEWKLIGSLLSENEELDKDKLDSMKDAFDDLEIIDVERKPKFLPPVLRTAMSLSPPTMWKSLKIPRNRCSARAFNC